MIYKIILIFLFVTLNSCADNYTTRNICKIPINWNQNKIEMDEPENYISISVYDKYYESEGYKFDNDRDFQSFIKNRKDYAVFIGKELPFIFLRSNDEVTCERFTQAVNVVQSQYPCRNRKLCIWGYGIGDKTEPIGIYPPPAEN